MNFKDKYYYADKTKNIFETIASAMLFSATIMFMLLMM